MKSCANANHMAFNALLSFQSHQINVWFTLHNSSPCGQQTYSHCGFLDHVSDQWTEGPTIQDHTHETRHWNDTVQTVQGVCVLISREICVWGWIKVHTFCLCLCNVKKTCMVLLCRSTKTYGETGFRERLWMTAEERGEEGLLSLYNHHSWDLPLIRGFLLAISKKKHLRQQDQG